MHTFIHKDAHTHTHTHVCVQARAYAHFYNEHKLLKLRPQPQQQHKKKRTIVFEREWQHPIGFAKPCSCIYQPYPDDFFVKKKRDFKINIIKDRTKNE